MSAALLLGHRGSRATKSIPENTIESFDLALEHGCDGFEFDVRRTADGRAVICHDPQFGGVEIAAVGAIQLRDVLALEQVLTRYPKRAFLDIELKVAGLEQHILEALKTHPPGKGFVVSSFLPDVLQSLRILDPDLPLGLICETHSQFDAWKRLPVQFVMPHFTLLDGGQCEILHAARKKVLTWTVNSREMILQVSDYGVDGIISDDTLLLRETLRPKGKQAE